MELLHKILHTCHPFSYYRQDAANSCYLNLFTGRKSAFLPRRSDSLHQFPWNLAQPRGMCVRLAKQNFMPIDARGGKNFLFCRDAPQASISMVTLTFDLRMRSWVTCDMGFLPAEFQLPTPFHSRLGSGTGHTEQPSVHYAPSLWERLHNKQPELLLQKHYL